MIKSTSLEVMANCLPKVPIDLSMRENPEQLEHCDDSASHHLFEELKYLASHSIRRRQLRVRRLRSNPPSRSRPSHNQSCRPILCPVPFWLQILGYRYPAQVTSSDSKRKKIPERARLEPLVDVQGYQSGKYSHNFLLDNLKPFGIPATELP